MKGGSEYAKRVKKLYHQWVRQFGKPAPAEITDPIEQIVIGILAICTSLTKAVAAYQKMRQHMVDLNELRVTPPPELAKLIGNAVPLAAEKAQRIVNALNDVRRRQDALDLSFLKQRGRREAREYLESLEGVDRSAAASVVLYSLGGHAIPLDDLTLYVLRKEELVAPTADLAEAQSFLERHVHAADAQVFVGLMGRYVTSRVPRGISMERIGELLSPPPPPEAKPKEQKRTKTKAKAAATPASAKPPAKKAKAAQAAPRKKKPKTKPATKKSATKKPATKRSVTKASATKASRTKGAKAKRVAKKSVKKAKKKTKKKAKSA